VDTGLDRILNRKNEKLENKNMHPIKRGALIALFSFGAIAGFGHGIAAVACHAGSCHQSRRAEFEDHVAEVCTRAAERVQSERGDRDRDRDDDRRPDARYVPYGAPQWGWGPPPSAVQWGPPPAPAYAPPAPAAAPVAPAAPADAPVADAPVAE
jgi:hypothetical protein